MHGDLGLLHNSVVEVQSQVQKTLRQGLQQINRLVLHVVHDGLGQVAVVHGLAQVVAKGGFVAVDPNGGIDEEVLPILSLKIEDAVVRINPQSGDLDFVAHALTLEINRGAG